MATFSDFYNQQRAAAPRRTPSSPAAGSYDFSWMPKAGQTVEEPEPQSPLNWAIDLLSRPLYGVTTAVGGVMDSLEKTGTGGDVEGAAGALGSIAAAPTNFLAGLFDTTGGEGTKRSTSDLIEQGTDIAGRTDPNYVDQEDNVNTVLKGVAGFVGDVALDPLTWIPGGILLKGAKGVGGLVKTGVEAAETAVKTARGGSKITEATAPAARAIEDVAEQAPAVKPTMIDDVVDEGNPYATDARRPKDMTPSVEAPPVPKVDYVSWAKTVKSPEVQKALSAHEKLLSGAKVTPAQLAKSEAQLAGLHAKLTKTPAAPVEIGDRTLSQTLGDAPKTPLIRQELQAVLDSVGSTGPVPKIDKAWLTANRNVKINDVPATLAGPPAQFVTLFRDIGESTAIRGTKPISVERAVKIMSQPSLPEAVRTYAKKLVEHVHRQSVGSNTSDVADALTAYRMRRDADLAKMQDTLGKPLFDVLQRKNTAKAFEASVQKVLKALDPEADLAKFHSANPQLSNALHDSLNVPRFVKPQANIPVEATAAAEGLTGSDVTFRIVAEVMRRELPLGKTFKKEFVERQGAVAFTDLDKALRKGNRFLELNTMTQQSLSNKLWREIEAQAAASTGKTMKLSEEGALKGMPRNRAVADAYQVIGEELVGALQTLGVKLHIGIGEDLLPITFPEVYRLVGDAIPSESLRMFTLYNGGTRVAITPLLQAVHRAVMAGDNIAESALRQEVEGIISGTVKYGKKGEAGEKLPNNITDASKVGKFKTTPEKLINTLVDGIMAARPALAARISDNATRWAARGVDEASQLGQKALNELKAVIGDDVFSDGVNAITSIRSKVAKDGAEIGSTPEGIDAAAEVAEASVGKTTVKIAKTAKNVESAVKAGVKRKAAVGKGSQKVMDDLTDEQKELIDQEMPDVDQPGTVKTGTDEGPAIDLASMKPDPVYAQQSFVGNALNGFLNVFDHTHGMDKVWDISHSKRTVAGVYLHGIVNAVRDLRKLPEDVQIAGIKAVQSGLINASPEVSQASALADKVFRTMFGSKDTLLDHKFLSVEQDLDHINAILRQKLGKETNFQMGEDIADWRQWDIKDSRDLVKLADAAATVAEHRSFVSSFVKTMSDEKLISDVPKPGYVRLTDSGGSTFAHLLPEGIFVEREMASQLHRLDVLTRTSRQFSDEVGKFINDYYMPVQSIWKQLITVFRPGHHLRNVAGNNFMSWIDRGNRHYLTSQRDAVKVLASRNNYNDMDLVKALKDFGEGKIPTGGDTIVRGRFGDMTVDEIYDLAQKHGFLSSYAAIEDLMTEVGKGSIARVGAAISNSKIGNVAGNVSHAIDHHAKLQHFIQILKQEAGGGRYSRYGRSLSKAKVIERAVRDVKRSHPDALMLTPTESKFRFLIPFYTWFAKTLPFAMESAARNPGRVIAIPKASYNLAVANGVNPDSISDPFPEDQMFPSYITEGVFGPQFRGPDGEYININPGVPQFDLLKDVGSDPIRGFAGMVSPLLRVPAELLSGGQWATGAQIKDTSDYLDQNLPIINYMANLSGTSVTGSAVSALSGQGLDPQRQVAAGNKGQFDQALAFMNWLTGANSQNWSRPNIINYAEIEKRNRESGNTGGF